MSTLKRKAALTTIATDKSASGYACGHPYAKEEAEIGFGPEKPRANRHVPRVTGYVRRWWNGCGRGGRRTRRAHGPSLQGQVEDGPHRKHGLRKSSTNCATRWALDLVPYSARHTFGTDVMKATHGDAKLVQEARVDHHHAGLPASRQGEMTDLINQRNRSREEGAAITTEADVLTGTANGR
jgi:hypothetical protein